MEQLKKNLLLIYIITFLDLVSIGIIFPIFGPYVRSLGYSHFVVGIISSTYSAIQVLSGPVIGSWCDSRGRKPVLIITLLASAISYFCLGFSNSLATILLIRFFNGIFKHTQTLTKAIIADLIGDDRNMSAKVYGRSVAIGSMGFVIGPVIGGHISDNNPYGFTCICIVTSLLFLVTIAISLMLPETLPNKKPTINTMETYITEIKNSFVDLKRVDWKHHWVAFALKYLFVLCTTVFFVNQAVLLKERYELSQTQIGYLISFISIIGVLTSLLMGKISQWFYAEDKFGVQRTFHGFLIISLCYLGLYFVDSVYLTIVLLLPFGMCNALLRIVTMEVLLNKCKEDERGSLTGASDSMMSLGRFTAPLSSGLISDTFGEKSIMLYAGAVSFIGCFLTSKIDTSDVKMKTK